MGPMDGRYDVDPPVSNENECWWCGNGSGKYLCSRLCEEGALKMCQDCGKSYPCELDGTVDGPVCDGCLDRIKGCE